MLCERHHDQYDGRAKPRIAIVALSARGADGRLRFACPEWNWSRTEPSLPARPRHEAEDEWDGD